jgi:hypothetical protein
MRPSLRAYEFCGTTIASEIPLTHLRRGTRRGIGCSIALDRSGPRHPPAAWFHEWRPRGRGSRLAIGRCSEGYLLRFGALADCVVSADGSRVVAHPAGNLPDETLRHLLIDQVLPLALSRQGRLSLHASAVHVPRFGTVAFVGRTGRGKSTLAAALAARGGRIVTDDCLALDFGAAGIRAVPGYPGLRLWPGLAMNALFDAAPPRRVAHYSPKRRVPKGVLPFHSRPSPLRALFLLSPRAAAGATVTLRRCRPAAAMIALLRCAYVLDVEDRRDLATLFNGLAVLAATVPVAHLTLRHGHSRLAAAADAIRASARLALPPRR